MLERRSNSIVKIALFQDLVTIVYRRTIFQSYSILELNNKGKKKRKLKKENKKKKNPNQKGNKGEK